jgi:hypothetical protein
VIVAPRQRHQRRQRVHRRAPQLPQCKAHVAHNIIHKPHAAPIANLLPHLLRAAKR